ncbi:PAS domain S-box protein [Kaarinaea lacus]
MFNFSSILHPRIIQLLVAWLLCSTTALADDDPREFVVGTWDNPPIVFRDASGEITGLGIDIIKYTAKQHGWNLTFRHGTWAEKYDELQKGTIDLLVGIAYTPERNELFDYPEQTVINNWGVIYQTLDHDFTSIQDLQGRRVAMVTKIIHSKVFTETMDRFNFPFETVDAKDFEDVLKLLEAGKADAGIINRVVSIMKADKYHVKPTTIIFNPVQVRMAVPKGRNPELIKALDDYLSAAKADSGSLYYQSVHRWLKTQGQKPDYSWIVPVLIILFIIFLLTAAYIYLVRREVKRRTAALAESENRFRQMADNINSVFWISSADGKEMIYVSPAYEKIWGKSAESLYKNPESWMYSMHPDDRAHMQEDIAELTASDKPGPAVREYRIIRPDDKEYWIAERSYPVYDNTGRLYRIAGIAEDITARKLAELGLARSKAEFEAIFNSISDAVVYGDLDRNIVLVNPALKDIFGYTNEELLGKKTEILYANKADYIQQGRRQFDKTSNIKSATYEVRYIRKDGSTFIGETLGAKVFDNDGNSIGLIGVIRDVSQRKQVESELLQHRDHLEELVTERTAELSNLNRELEAFSYSVSHDLRAPLRAINGFSTLLCEEYQQQLDDEGKDYLNRIVKASVKMERLIDDLLQISRVSRADLNKENVDLSAIAEEILKNLHNQEPQRQVKWEIEKGLLAKGDKTLLHVMMQNLLGNAWKYTTKTPNAEIRFHRCATKEAADAFCIEDNGSGFDAKYKDKIFQPFQRLHTDKEFEGTGIGLATVNRVIHRHSGEIWAESIVDGGSRFYFRL